MQFSMMMLRTCVVCANTVSFCRHPESNEAMPLCHGPTCSATEQVGPQLLNLDHVLLKFGELVDAEELPTPASLIHDLWLALG